MPNDNIIISFDTDSFLRDFQTEYILKGEIFLSDENINKYIKYREPKSYTYQDLIDKMESGNGI